MQERCLATETYGCGANELEARATLFAQMIIVGDTYWKTRSFKRARRNATETVGKSRVARRLNGQ